jgi:hypothetical protein
VRPKQFIYWPNFVARSVWILKQEYLVQLHHRPVAPWCTVHSAVLLLLLWPTLLQYEWWRYPPPNTQLHRPIKIRPIDKIRGAIHPFPHASSRRDVCLSTGTALLLYLTSPCLSCGTVPQCLNATIPTGRVEVKLSLCLTKHHAMKTFGRVEV